MYAPPQERHPRFGAVPALRLWRRHGLPTRERRARPQCQQDCCPEPTHLSETLTQTCGHTQRQKCTHTHTQTHAQQIHKLVTDTDIHFSALHTPEMLTHTHRHPTPKTFFPAKVADTNSTRKDRHDAWKNDTPRGMQQCKMD